jgi:L-lactate dehydrogenase complex protein LldG
VERRAAAGGDRLTVTSAYAGVAETGSLVLLSSAQSPTTLNFLPDDHVIVVRESQIVKHIEDVWARMRSDKRAMPRTVNFITGPSKTADVEQTIQEGAHGPRRLHVILVAE